MSDLAFLIPLFATALVLSVTIGLAAVGETIGQRTGILNLGLEGMMLSGALGAFLGAYYTGSAWAGVLFGIVGGLALTSLMGALVITLKAEQVVAGVLIVLLSLGLTSFVYGSLFHSGTPPRIGGTGRLDVPLLSDLPVLGPILFQQNLLVYLGVALILWNGRPLHPTR